MCLSAGDHIPKLTFCLLHMLPETLGIASQAIKKASTGMLLQDEHMDLAEAVVLAKSEK